MTTNIFGKSITRKFYPVEDGEPINLPSQSPSIYLFTTQPTMTAARAGTGAAATINYWTASAFNPYVRTYSIPAIDDPDPTSSIDEYDYWEAINFVGEASEQQQTVLRTLPLQRVQATETIPDTTLQDIKDIYPKISSYANDLELAAYLVTALIELKLELNNMGIEWGRTNNLKDLKLALAYKVIQFVSEAQIVEDNDKFVIRRQIYKERFADLMKIVKIGEDTDEDGDTDQIANPDSIAVIGSR